MTEPSRAESSELVPVLSQQDLVEVASLSSRVARLEQELELARLQLRDAWARVPCDERLVKPAYQSDIKATCKECGQLTKWRVQGMALCQPACKVARERVKTTHGIPQAVWDILEGVSEVEESLDDD